MTVHEMKAAFVANELSALIKKIDKDVARVEYTAREDGEELVSVYSSDGCPVLVCVTADSLAALTCDVFKKLKKQWDIIG